MAEYCPTCKRGSWACACGLTFQQKLQSITINLHRPTTSYYDKDSIEKIFGEDATERMKEETQGVGPVSQAEWNHYQNWQSEIADFYTDGPEVSDDG